MSDLLHSDGEAGLRPRVTEAEGLAEPPPMRSAGPQVFATDEVEPLRPREIVRTAQQKPAKRDRFITLGVGGIAVFFIGWLMIDAAAWISAAFERSLPLGLFAAAAVGAGVAGAGLVSAREALSLFRLKNVETIRRRLADEHLATAEARQSIAQIVAMIPREPPLNAAVQSFQRQVQLHHNKGQQVALFSRSVLHPLDRRAEGHVRTAVLRAFGITAISPTALTDAVFFLACGVRMVRAIATEYGHRPTAAATIHLLRRLVFEAGKLGAIDIASASLVQHLGGAVTERFASTTAEALYAAYRMARLGIIVMDLCRPIAFAPEEIPSVGSLVGNVLRRRAQSQPALGHGSPD
jgi:putative membrane protein